MNEDIFDFSSLSVGDSVPEEIEFEVYQDNKIEKRSFADYRGKWLVVMFYPADFTFVCPTELEEMAELYPEFQKEEAEVLSVSTDTAYVHKAWHDESDAVGKVNFPMAADPTHILSDMFGVLIEDEGVALRGTFIIDPDGVIKTVEIHDNGIGREAKESLRKLQAAKFVREHGDKVCPAGWKPGGDTLEPGLDLVGKI